MTDVRAVFYILHGAMVIDGHVDDSEVELIELFLKKQILEVDFVIRDEVHALLTDEAYFSKSMKAAIEYIRSKDLEFRKTVLRLVVAMVRIDGKIEDDEVAYLVNIGEAWNVNVPALINETH